MDKFILNYSKKIRFLNIALPFKQKNIKYASFQTKTAEIQQKLFFSSNLTTVCKVRRRTVFQRQKRRQSLGKSKHKIQCRHIIQREYAKLHTNPKHKGYAENAALSNPINPTARQSKQPFTLYQI